MNRTIEKKESGLVGGALLGGLLLLGVVTHTDKVSELEDKRENMSVDYRSNLSEAQLEQITAKLAEFESKEAFFTAKANNR